VALACGSSTPVSPTATTITTASTTAPITPATVDPPVTAANTLSAPEVLVGAGDISQCGLDGAAQTASLMTGLLHDARATGFTLGDNSNDDGSREKVLNCLEPTWGAFKDRLMPSPGNHDYEADATNPFYYEYFGAAAGPKPLGYYSYDRGNWHILSLNSELPDGPMRQAQLDWMAADLRAHPSACTLAYFHRPLFSSGRYAAQRMKKLWDVLYRGGTDVIVNGHEHFYAAFPPMTPDGTPDQSFGIRQIIAGTGGARLFDRPPATYGETIITGRWGVLVLRLSAADYDWNFVATDGAVLDAGHGTCHAAPKL
jgi:hypothetical protein